MWREYQLSIDIAPIPLNVILRLWERFYWWMLRGGPQGRTLAEHHYHIGYEAGFEQGKTTAWAQMMCADSEAGRLMRIGKFVDDTHARLSSGHATDNPPTPIDAMTDSTTGRSRTEPKEEGSR